MISYGGWIKLLNLTLNLWTRQCFEAIGSQLGGFVSCSHKTFDFQEALIDPIPKKKKKKKKLL